MSSDLSSDSFAQVVARVVDDAKGVAQAEVDLVKARLFGRFVIGGPHGDAGW